jgi:hypothetical protein
MKRQFVIRAALAAIVPLALAACAGSGGTTVTTQVAAEPTTTIAPTATTEGAVRPATHNDYDTSKFNNSTDVSNKWLPLVPGTQYVLSGQINAEGKRVEHRVVFTVTDLTKQIDGVQSRVLYDVDYNAGKVAEAELAFFAQDDSGNVWLLGEYPEEFEGGKFAGAPSSWITGQAGAKAGIMMRADPRPKTSSYLQGLVPAIEFHDTAKVYQTGVKTCVPVKCYQNVLVTEEWNPDEPDARQHKYYAPGVGNIRADFAGTQETEKETLLLTKLVHLSPAALAQARQAALRLDKHAYTVARAVYAKTPPAQQS